MRTVAAAAALVAPIFLAGCLATQKDVLDLSQQNDDLKTQVSELKKSLSAMQASQADLSVQIKQVHEDMTAYSETTKSAIGDMAQLSSKLDEMGAQLAGKVTQLGTALSAQQEKGLEQQQKELESQKSELEAQGRETEATELLLTAEKRLQSHDYGQSASGLENYLKRFPSGSMTDVATYDLGLAYFGLKKWESAGTQFAIVIEKFPKSGQTAGARLHYAYSLEHIKKKRSEAKTYLESITADFPNTPEAKEAAAELKRLNK